MTENKVTVTQALTAKRDRVHPSNRRPDLPMMLKISFGDLETIIDALAQHRTRSTVGEGTTRDGIIDAYLVSPYRNQNGDRQEQIVADPAAYVEYIRTYKPMALEEARRVADFVLSLEASPKANDSVDAVREAYERGVRESAEIVGQAGATNPDNLHPGKLNDYDNGWVSACRMNSQSILDLIPGAKP